MAALQDSRTASDLARLAPAPASMGSLPVRVRSRWGNLPVVPALPRTFLAAA